MDLSNYFLAKGNSALVLDSLVQPASGVEQGGQQTASGMQESAAHEVLRRNSVRVIGEGKPTIFLCHGFGCNQQIWHYLTTPLAARYQLVLFDHVGAGESDIQAYDPVKYASLDGYAQYIVEICQALKLQEVVIVGHSVGAMIAMLAVI